MALIALAEEAQDIAAGFNKFLETVPEISTEITGLISECYAISSALRELYTAKEDPRYAYDYDYVSRDVIIARQCLKYTFHDVFRLFGGLGRPSYISNKTAYYQVWRDIEDHFYQEASSEYKYQELQDRTMALLGKQELRLEAAFNNLSLGEAGQLSSHGTSDEGLRRADRGNCQAPIDKDRSSEGGRQHFSPKLQRRLQFCEE
ncbi:MAG: hypothetical protein Q9185_006121 [Variospora sp. 1 TL-2023]